MIALQTPRSVVSCKQPATISEGAGAAIVYQNDHWQTGMLIAPGCFVFGFLAGIAAFSGYDQLAARQKFFAHLNSLIQQTAGVAAQIQNERLGPFGLEFAQAIFEIGGGMLPNWTRRM